MSAFILAGWVYSNLFFILELRLFLVHVSIIYSVFVGSIQNVVFFVESKFCNQIWDLYKQTT